MWRAETKEVVTAMTASYKNLTAHSDCNLRTYQHTSKILMDFLRIRIFAPKKMDAAPIFMTKQVAANQITVFNQPRPPNLVRFIDLSHILCKTSSCPLTSTYLYTINALRYQFNNY